MASKPSDATYRALCANGLTAEVAWFLAVLEARVTDLEAQMRESVSPQEPPDAE